MKYAKNDKAQKIKLNFFKNKNIKAFAAAFLQKFSNYINWIRRKFKGNWLRIFSIFMFIFIAINVFLNRHYLTPDQVVTFFKDKLVSLGDGEGFPRAIYGEKVSSQNFQLLDKDIVFVSDTNVTCYSKRSKEIFNRQHNLLNPILKTNKNKALLYDLYGTKFEIACKSKTLYKSTAEEGILSAAIAENGTYGIVTKANGYFSQMSIFKRLSADKIYEYFFSDTYISDLDISPNGRKFCAVGLSSQNGCMYSNLFIFDCDDENPKFKIQFKDSMIFKICYLSSDYVAVLGDNIFSVVNVKDGQAKDYNFENKALTAFEINKDDYNVLSLSNSDDGNSCKIIVFDRKGSILGNFKTDIKIKSISYKNRRIAALSYDDIYVYNKKGKLIKTLKCDQNTKVIKFFASKKLYSLGSSNIQKISF